MSDDTSAEHERSPTPRFDHIDTTVGRDILAAIAEELRGPLLSRKPFVSLTENEQETTLRRLEQRIRLAVRKGFAVMVGGDFPNAIATLEKVAFSAKGVQGTLSLGAASEHRHSLSDHAGRPVIVVLASPEKYLERMDEIRGEADQAQLNLEIEADDTSGFDSERHDPSQPGATDAPDGGDVATGAGDGEALPPVDGEEKTGEAVDLYPGEITREVVVDMLALVDVEADLETVGTWDQDTRRAVLDWAGAEHLRAQGHEVHVPERPEVLDLDDEAGSDAAAGDEGAP